MPMDDLERKLKSLAVREPSAALDARIHKALEARSAMEEARSAERGARRDSRLSPAEGSRFTLRNFFSALRMVSWRWALAAALLMGLLGFWAGRHLPAGGGDRLSAGESAGAPAVTVHVVYEGRGANPLDFTVAADDGLQPIRDIQFSPDRQTDLKKL